MSETAATPQYLAAPGRSAERGLAALRILFGLVYLSNAFAKLVDVSDFRIGPFGANLIARANARGILEGAARDTWIAPLGALYESLVLPNWGFFIAFLTIAEFAIGLGLLFGVATRLAALGALLLIGPIWVMLLDEGPYLWQYPVELVPLAILAIVPSGRTAGLDGRLAARFHGRWPF
jgi:thiosulfate dehydrogenase (quinone) large subunit